MPTKPAPPVTKIIFFFDISFTISINFINQYYDGLYHDLFPNIELKRPLNLQK